jgi:hypothetical protein
MGAVVIDSCRVMYSALKYDSVHSWARIRRFSKLNVPTRRQGDHPGDSPREGCMHGGAPSRSGRRDPWQAVAKAVIMKESKALAV